MLDNIAKYHNGGRHMALIAKAAFAIIVVLIGMLLIYKLLGRL